MSKKTAGSRTTIDRTTIDAYDKLTLAIENIEVLAGLLADKLPDLDASGNHAYAFSIVATHIEVLAGTVREQAALLRGAL